MHQPQVISRALHTHNYRKDVAETGGLRDRNPSDILGKAQDSLYTSKTGLRRLLGGSSNKEIAVSSTVPEEPETLEISEPSRQFSSTEGVATRVAKTRRSSMTTYTVNLGGAVGIQAEREVRRLAGLTTAFARPSGPGDTPTIAHATSFDAIEEMACPGAGTNPGDESDIDGSCQYRPASSALFGGSIRIGTAAGGGRGPVRAAFGAAGSTASGDSCQVSGCGDSPGLRHSVELADVTSMPSTTSLTFATSDNRGALHAATARPVQALTLPHAFVCPASAAAAAAAAASGSGGNTSNAGSLPVSPVTSISGSQLLGHLGLMRDRKTPRHNTVDSFSPPSSLGGSISTGTPGCGGGVTTAASTVSVLSGGVPLPISVLKLPNLPATPGKGHSSTQIGPNQSLFTPTGCGGGGAAPSCDSRPGSSRLAQGRGATTNILVVPDRRISVENIELGAGIITGGGGAMARAGAECAGPGGGRWFQQDTEDIEALLAGNEELLERLMSAGYTSGTGTGTGTGNAVGGRPSQSTGDGSSPPGEPGLLLPRLADAASDRATAQLQELWRVQANVEDQLNRDRQALATGRTRRASVLEDVAGQHQPRWQVSYNVEGPANHGKLGVVDASRRSELDRAHLVKLVKEQKAAPPAIPAAAVSPVVARARRLSTVMVA
ncbi:hypothetical protein Vretimale_2807 [Volvox reticuliferus]|uniref:Uncharacterized protein n=1 Tax=Volvox reticuliferus TaxID=1737510 RepID=A0A8J4DAS7_9CHLO|nr:hypothetical protein Vretifemale_6834 [Volvox reticuliferus]GIL97331.1 hypothetical protein Vretimale_2807 [Volvox reticuliferus]